MVVTWVTVAFGHIQADMVRTRFTAAVSHLLVIWANPGGAQGMVSLQEISPRKQVASFRLLAALETGHVLEIFQGKLLWVTGVGYAETQP